MSGITLKIQDLENITGKKVSQIAPLNKLDLSGSRIKYIEPGIFKKFQKIKSLNLSNNVIRSVPLDLGLPCLRELNISQNQVTSLEFLAQFPSLEELICEENGLENDDKHVAVYFCRKLKKIDGKSTEKWNTLVNGCSEKFQSIVESTWIEEFGDLDASDALSVKDEFVKKVKKQNPFYPTAQQKFKEFLIKQLCNDLVSKVVDGTFEPKTTKIKRLKKSVTEQISSDLNSCRIASPRRRSTAKKFNGKCDSICDYEPVHFLRCHFGDRTAAKNGHKDNDPSDEITNVWWCAMEPDPVNPEETTGVVATCGGNIVCLVDCSTGTVMKRYQHTKEQFCCLAWTTLTLEGEGAQQPTNILAVGGSNGHLKLLHPAQFVCYAEHGTGRPNRAVGDFYYSCLLFHPNRKTWLFCGSSDTTITLFDIGVPSAAEYQTDIQQLLVIKTSSSAIIMNMIYHEPSNSLVSGTEKGCLAWELNCEAISKGNARRSEETHIKLPGSNNKKPKCVDGLVFLDKNHVACKCVSDGCIYVFNLTQKLNDKDAPVLSLAWHTTEVDYISLGSSNGLLACGSDDGNLWLYNLKSWLDSGSTSYDTQLIQPSKIIPWPLCRIDGKREEELKMSLVLEKPKPLCINCCSISSNGDYIVTVTDCNLVCIWKQLSS